MILQPDLFSFAYVPDWYIQLDALAEMALPEPWRFRNPIYLTKNPDTPILERYIHVIFKKQLIDYKDERNPGKAAEMFHIENEHACFHTGLYTPRYKAIYACFGRNKKKDSMLEWYFRGFADELSHQLRYISPLPKKPRYYMTQNGVNYNPEWPIRVNVDHILGDEENYFRLPAEIRDARNLPLRRNPVPGIRQRSRSCLRSTVRRSCPALIRRSIRHSLQKWRCCDGWTRFIVGIFQPPMAELPAVRKAVREL